ncbi:hypothetical protein JYK00_08065 [Thermosipho ferrireducens]|uniref:Uncharacterized protein n=1 Tax=Thermosipho ferrireducens TaxID=2571116 RepID=A0ABX7S582_9BACT|nr:hypothetical protein [Thermosipho ferrireducens]QTA37674.1 hypothetical protein JYK00_08065 [Thermosipho ferrireducens]
MENEFKEYNITWERYEKALTKILKDFANRGIEEVSLEELWIETSLPKDLILEILERKNIKFPDEILKIFDGEKVIWSREKS